MTVDGPHASLDGPARRARRFVQKCFSERLRAESLSAPRKLIRATVDTGEQEQKG
jgi:hypothetical protein